MSDNELTPRVLAGLALGEDPGLFLSFRIMPDRSVVVIDHVGRKFILTQAELAKVEGEVISRRLHARGRALVEDLKNGAQEIGPVKVASMRSLTPAPAKKQAVNKPSSKRSTAVKSVTINKKPSSKKTAVKGRKEHGNTAQAKPKVKPS